MAERSINDLGLQINSTSNNPSIDKTDWRDIIEDNLFKSQALIDVALHQGLYDCSKLTQHYYFSIIHDLLIEVKNGFEHLQSA